ncbi:MAG TPA: hypothetical protein ACFCUC_10165 [Desulfobacterales bacterium]
MTRELRHSGEAVEKRLLGLRTEIDRLKVEMAALTRFLESKHPELSDDIGRLRRETVREVDPEFK